MLAAAGPEPWERPRRTQCLPLPRPPWCFWEEAQEVRLQASGLCHVCSAQAGGARGEHSPGVLGEPCHPRGGRALLAWPQRDAHSPTCSSPDPGQKEETSIAGAPPWAWPWGLYLLWDQHPVLLYGWGPGAQSGEKTHPELQDSALKQVLHIPIIWITQIYWKFSKNPNEFVLVPNAHIDEPFQRALRNNSSSE